MRADRGLGKRPTRGAGGWEEDGTRGQAGGTRMKHRRSTPSPRRLAPARPTHGGEAGESTRRAKTRMVEDVRGRSYGGLTRSVLCSGDGG